MEPLSRDNRESGGSFRSTHRDSIANPNWTFSDNNYPRGNDPVILFDGQGCSVKTCKDLDKDRAVISKVPSRWCRTVYVYDSGMFAAHDDSNFFITSKKGQGDDLRWMSTIHLEKLPLSVRGRVFTRQIKWIFVTNNSSRSSTESSN